jgi:hypothetical protein
VCGATQLFIYVNNLINYVLQLSVLEKVNLINKIKKVECAHDGEFREYWWSNGIGSTQSVSVVAPLVTALVVE